MNLEDIIYDIKTIANQDTEDARLNDSFLIYKVNEYRALFIQEQYRKTREFDPSWLQTLNSIDLTCVGSSDDPNISGESIRLGKTTLPAVISLPDDLGFYRLSSASMQKQIYRTDPHLFFMMFEINDLRLNNFMHYFVIENSVYVYPYEQKVSGLFVLENPLDGYRKNTEKVKPNGLLNGHIYVVVGYQINYAGTWYSPGSIFTATNANGLFYTSDINNGWVMDIDYFDQKDITMSYPCDAAMAERIVLEILTKDLKIESAMINDIKQDFQDQLKIVNQGLRK